MLDDGVLDSRKNGVSACLNDIGVEVARLAGYRLRWDLEKLRGSRMAMVNSTRRLIHKASTLHRLLTEPTETTPIAAGLLDAAASLLKLAESGQVPLPEGGGS